jgi:hypothetical protein
MLDARKQLQETARRITEWRALIAHRRRIAKMKKGGHSDTASSALLREMEVSLNAMRQERMEIERRIEGHRGLVRAAVPAPLVVTK